MRCYESVDSTPEAVGEFNRKEIEVWRRAIATAKIQPE